MNIVVVFTINNKFATPTYIAINSLFKNAEKQTVYECIVISNNLSKMNKTTIESLAQNTRHSIRCISVEDELIYAPKVTNLWPKVVYYRLYLCEILGEYKKIIYSDVDVFFKGDLSDVWSMEIDNIEIAAVAAEKNNENVVIHQYYKENKKEYIYWDGFMVMNLELMRKNNWIKRCLKNLEMKQDSIKMFDLEIINLTAQAIKRLPLRYVFLQTLYDLENIEESDDYIFLKKLYSKEEILDEKKNVIIVHYAGGEGKPWIRKNIPSYYISYMVDLPLLLKLQNYYWRIEDRCRKKVSYYINLVRNKKKKL